MRAAVIECMKMQNEQGTDMTHGQLERINVRLWTNVFALNKQSPDRGAERQNKTQSLVLL